MLLLLACAGGSGDNDLSTDDGCDIGKVAVVTEIDGTLSLADDAFMAWFDDPPTEVPLRAGAETLFDGYRERGAYVAYITSLSDDWVLSDGRGLGEALTDWLEDNGLPFDRLDMDDGSGAGDVVELKRGHLRALAADGFEVRWAYGDDADDAAAYADLANSWIVGDTLPEADAFEAHAESQLEALGEECL